VAASGDIDQYAELRNQGTASTICDDGNRHRSLCSSLLPTPLTAAIGTQRWLRYTNNRIDTKVRAGHPLFQKGCLNRRPKLHRINAGSHRSGCFRSCGLRYTSWSQPKSEGNFRVGDNPPTRPDSGHSKVSMADVACPIFVPASLVQTGTEKTGTHHFQTTEITAHPWQPHRRCSISPHVATITMSFQTMLTTAR
jgi:hypothetical protein